MSRLKQLLEEEKGLVTRFLDVLREEQSALVEGLAETLSGLSQTKLELVNALNAAEAARGAIIAASTAGNGKAEMKAWLLRHPAERAASLLWEDILGLAQEARQLHEMNGELIAMHLSKTTEAIDILTQRQKEAALYGSNGQAASGTGSRIVDSA